MRLYFLNVLVFLSIHSLIAQVEVPLRLSNYEPRVGEIINVLFDIDFIAQSLDSQLATYSSIELPQRNYGWNSGYVSRSIIFKDTGCRHVGPFFFQYNGIKYTTDSITVFVQPELPAINVVWLRHLVKNGNHYLIIESQYLDSKMRRKTRDKSVSLDFKKLPWVKARESQSHSSSSKMSYYSKKVYTLTPSSETNTIIIDANMLLNLPKGIHVEPLLLKL